VFVGGRPADRCPATYKRDPYSCPVKERQEPAVTAETSARRLRLIVADDQVVAQRGAVFYLEALGFEVCATLDDSRRLGVAYDEHHPDVVVIEVTSGARGAAFGDIASLVAAHPEAAVLALTCDLSPVIVEGSLEHGCCGVVPKTCSVDALGVAVRTAACGGRYLHPRAIAALLQSRYSSDSIPTTSSLSLREVRVLSLVAEGMTNAAVGAELGISGETVKTHLSRVLAKLNAKDRTHAVSRALRLGLFP
jgi:DNA-binding NarL/FixJ family response regulator